eukprot:409932-Pelagomonas_calceolata.AAC.1
MHIANTKGSHKLALRIVIKGKRTKALMAVAQQTTCLSNANSKLEKKFRVRHASQADILSLCVSCCAMPTSPGQLPLQCPGKF